jgi:hypothetical protein
MIMLGCRGWWKARVSRLARTLRTTGLLLSFVACWSSLVWETVRSGVGGPSISSRVLTRRRPLGGALRRLLDGRLSGFTAGTDVKGSMLLIEAGGDG